jgi:hypothetical protein
LVTVPDSGQPAELADGSACWGLFEPSNRSEKPFGNGTSIGTTPNTLPIWQIELIAGFTQPMYAIRKPVVCRFRFKKK